jgi:ribose 5-phosphate isomerase B
MKKFAFIALLLMVIFAGYFVYSQKKTEVTETKKVESTQTIQSQVVADRTIEVKGLNFSYDLKEIKVKKGEKVAIQFTNTEGFHDFVIDELSVRTQKIGEGKTETILIPTDKVGTYAFYCSVGQHRKMGMEGKLIIEQFMKIYLGADHGGFELKEYLKTYLAQKGFAVEDCGAATLVPDDDYPVYAKIVAEKVLSDSDAKGILICRSGGGMAIAANRFKGIRAVDCMTVESAIHARTNNDANVLTLAAEWISQDDAEKIVDAFLETEFQKEERFVRRMEMVG